MDRHRTIVEHSLPNTRDDVSIILFIYIQVAALAPLALLLVLEASCAHFVINCALQ